LDAAVQEVRAAFEVLGNARRLAAIFETFIGVLGHGHINVPGEADMWVQRICERNNI